MKSSAYGKADESIENTSEILQSSIKNGERCVQFRVDWQLVYNQLSLTSTEWGSDTKLVSLHVEGESASALLTQNVNVEVYLQSRNLGIGIFLLGK